MDQFLSGRLHVILGTIQRRLKVNSFVLPFIAQFLCLLLSLLQLRIRHLVL